MKFPSIKFYHAVFLPREWCEVFLDVINCECKTNLCNKVKRKKKLVTLKQQIDRLSYVIYSSVVFVLPENITKITPKVNKFPESDTWCHILYFKNQWHFTLVMIISRIKAGILFADTKVWIDPNNCNYCLVLFDCDRMTEPGSLQCQKSLTYYKEVLPLRHSFLAGVRGLLGQHVLTYIHGYTFLPFCSCCT